MSLTPEDRALIMKAIGQTYWEPNDAYVWLAAATEDDLAPLLAAAREQPRQPPEDVREKVACIPDGSRVELVPPTFLARADGRGICVDACLALEVSRLWSAGIETTGCCCGHGLRAGYIGVAERDFPTMKALGYQVVENPCRPGDEDSFAPKSRCLALPAVAVGDGWRVVPVEPTEEMVTAFCESYLDVGPQRTPGMETRVRRARAKIAYRAMIQAAPPHGGGG